MCRRYIVANHYCNGLLWTKESGAVGAACFTNAPPTPRRLLAVYSTVTYTPCLRLAPMKSSRSPSSTAFVLLISTFVRRSLMRLLSST
jgi:hypothetical protein